jgi:uncharacterized lipoprotein YajG
MKNIIALLAFFLLSACTHRPESPITLPNTEIRAITSQQNSEMVQPLCKVSRLAMVLLSAPTA